MFIFWKTTFNISWCDWHQICSNKKMFQLRYTLLKYTLCTFDVLFLVVLKTISSLFGNKSFRNNERLIEVDFFFVKMICFVVFTEVKCRCMYKIYIITMRTNKKKYTFYFSIWLNYCINKILLFSLIFDTADYFCKNRIADEFCK